MTIAAVANDEQWEALTANTTGMEWIKAGNDFSFKQFPTADAFFILDEKAAVNYAETMQPVFINCVTATLPELHAPENVLRINGWHGFLQRPVWEIAGRVNERITIITKKMNKKIIPVKDVPGMLAANIIAMIINEAYFAWGDNVSSKAEIDTAMKLGTNYPYGPFEWAERIGINNIFILLDKLSASDKRYQPAPALIAAIQNT